MEMYKRESFLLIGRVGVLDCHDQNEILPVEPYLVVGDTSKGANQAPQRVRELLAKGVSGYTIQFG